jgi:hypothetical protein
MYRLIFRLAPLPLFFLSATLFFIRVQPYDGRAVRTFLLSDECSTPCFMGIRPGVTTPQEALRQLRSTGLISYVGVSEPLETVAWFGDKSGATLMDDSQIQALFYNRGKVSSIRLYTRIRLGDLLLALESMSNQRVAIRQVGPYNSYNVDLYYVGKDYVVNATVNCHNFWTQPTYVILGERPAFIDTQARNSSLNNAKHLIASNCRRRNEG